MSSDDYSKLKSSAVGMKSSAVEMRKIGGGNRPMT